MKCYSVLPYEHQDIITNKLVEFVETQTNILSGEHFWHFVGIKRIMDFIPEFNDFLAAHNLPRPIISAFVYAGDMQGNIHVDKGRDIRLLWPVMNCAGSKTRFFHVEEEYIQLVTDNDLVNSPYNTITKPEPYEQLAELELLEPVVFNSGIPHGIYCNELANGPRVSFTMKFSAPIDHLLA